MTNEDRAAGLCLRVALLRQSVLGLGSVKTCMCVVWMNEWKLNVKCNTDPEFLLIVTCSHLQYRTISSTTSQDASTRELYNLIHHTFNRFTAPCFPPQFHLLFPRHLTRPWHFSSPTLLRHLLLGHLLAVCRIPWEYNNGAKHHWQTSPFAKKNTLHSALTRLPVHIFWAVARQPSSLWQQFCPVRG